MAMNYSEMEQELRSLREKMTIYEELLKETRRSEDRLQRSEDRLFRLVVGVVITLILSSIWYNYRVYNKDIEALQENIKRRVDEARSSLDQQHKGEMEAQFKKVEDKLWENSDRQLQQFLSETHKANAARFAGMSNQIAAQWEFIRKPEHSLEIAIEAFNKAMESGSNLWVGALGIMDRALKLASRDRQRLPNALLSEVQSILETPSIQGDAQVKTLQETLASYRATLSP